MKDIVIRSSVLRRETVVALVCFAAAFLLNVGAVIFYVRPWTEIFSQLGYVVVVSVVLYVFVAVIRLIFCGIRYIVKLF